MERTLSLPFTVHKKYFHSPCMFNSWWVGGHFVNQFLLTDWLLSSWGKNPQFQGCCRTNRYTVQTIFEPTGIQVRNHHVVISLTYSSSPPWIIRLKRTLSIACFLPRHVHPLKFLHHNFAHPGFPLPGGIHRKATLGASLAPY